MARILIVTPARPGARNGNRHTAYRWAAFLRSAGHRVRIASEWDDMSCDLLIALHARRSHAAALAYRRRHPDGPLVVALTGTDLYQDLPASREARDSLRMADRIVVLQSDAKAQLKEFLRPKTRVVYQSSGSALRRAPPDGIFRVVVVGHLRKVKDPFRTALALAHVDANLDVVQIGDALEPGYAAQAARHMRRDARYRWLGGRTHAQALGWIARSHVLVVSSFMEGGANVIAEAARIGTPVLASRMSGNLGMLGRTYPGYYPLCDEKALARLIEKCILEKALFRKLKRAISARCPLFSPAAEHAALARVVNEALRVKFSP